MIETGVTRVSDDDLERVHAPCGLDIGSRTAEETAVSVLAEIIAARARRAARPLRASSGPIHGRENAGMPAARATSTT